MSTSQPITISGERITAERTCDGGGTAGSYSQVVNLYQPGDNEFIVGGSGGLSSGMWVHHISTDVGGNQHQQTPVLVSTDPSTYATVRWTYHPTVITVFHALDGGTGTCGATCTFRQALNTANSLVTTTSAILIQFGVEPSTMSQSADLVAGSTTASPIITIDGTRSDGNPWIVGDALAAAQGNQDVPPVTLNLANVTKLRIDGNNVTIKGLHIVNVVPGGQTPAKVLIEGARNNTRIEAVRLAGGAAGPCTPPTCPGSAIKHLIELTGSGATIVNVEGYSAFGRGIQISGSAHEVRDSWLHHNYVDNIAADKTLFSRNMIELGGRSIANDDIVNSTAYGIFPFNLGDIETRRNVVRSHPQRGIEAQASTSQPFQPVLSHDYVCGNDTGGIHVSGGGAAFVRGTGLATVYNAEHGVNVSGPISSGALNFDNDSVFAANSLCGLKNSTTSFGVDARFNQWRGPNPTPVTSCTQSTDKCTPGTINCDPIQNPVTTPLSINGMEPTFPRNVFLRGQTVRVQGSGFNAIDGNPLPSPPPPAQSCSLGNDVSPENCCRKKSKANLCDTASPPNAVSGGGNCVALKNGAGGWRVLAVTGVTPTTIVTEITDTNPVFACVGTQNEAVRVSRMALGGPTAVEQPYCVNTAPL